MSWRIALYPGNHVHMDPEIPKESGKKPNAVPSIGKQVAETLLQNEIHPYREFLDVQGLFTPTEWKWIKTDSINRDTEYYTVSERKTVMGKLMALHELHESLKIMQTKEHMSINQYPTWTDDKRESLHKIIAAHVMPRSVNQLKDFGKADEFNIVRLQSLDAQTLAAYLQTFQIINKRTRDEVTADIQRNVLAKVETKQQVDKVQVLKMAYKSLPEKIGDKVHLGQAVSDAVQSVSDLHTLTRGLVVPLKHEGRMLCTLIATGANGVLVFRVEYLDDKERYMAFNPSGKIESDIFYHVHADVVRKIATYPEKVTDR